MFRKILFWIHLVTGLIGGLAIGVMCATGVLLSFEKQIIGWTERDARSIAAPQPGSVRLGLDELTHRVEGARPNARPASITVSRKPNAAVAFTFGRDDAVYVNPYTGEVRTPRSTRTREFMRGATEWHRWLALSDEHRTLGKTINGVCNAAFCLLAISGLYLWMPRTWSWRGVRAVALFNWRLAGKARDFNWHNSIGLWSAPILIVLTLTALPMSFRWANTLVYRLAGEPAPAQGPAAPAGPAVELAAPTNAARPLQRDALLAIAQAQFPTWEEITFRLSNPRGRENTAPSGSALNASPERRPNGPQPVTIVVKTSAAWPRTATSTVTLNPFNGDVLRMEAFGDQSPGRRFRGWTRFLHTGEALGWPGQLLAGLATLGGCFLVYTGFALAWRRFFGRAAASP